MISTPGGPLLAERPSGLIVPAHLASAPEGAPEGKKADGGRDDDGRRRIVLTRDVRRLFDRMAHQLRDLDLAMVLACRNQRQVPREAIDMKTGAKTVVMMIERIPDACGEVLVNEDLGGPDPGFGCKCTRVHFLAGA